VARVERHSPVNPKGNNHRVRRAIRYRDTHQYILSPDRDKSNA
jgi:hypothetical protein